MENKNHTLTMDNCAKCVMSGIEKVVGATASQLELASSCGTILIIGSDLAIGKFDNQTGSLSFAGKINAIKYNEVKTPFFKRLFK